MRDTIITAKCEFVPPYTGSFWVRAARPVLDRYLRNTWGIETVECRGTEHLKGSLAAGHGILLAPNH